MELMNRAALKEDSTYRYWTNAESTGEAALGNDGEMSQNPSFEMGSRHCAYNQTRECFLGLHIVIADIETPQLRHRLATLSLKSGEGLWLKPFREIPANIGSPLDLVYLDEEHRVIETVESFPTFLASPSIPHAASLLVLPLHSIYWSQTQRGDQLMLCEAEEMQNCLGKMTGANSQTGLPLWEKSMRRDGSLLVENKDGHDASSDETQPAGRMRIARRLQNWFQRWMAPDNRAAIREPAPDLEAYYWTGDAPQAHKVRDISATGLYLITDSRWYPGTVLLMNLQRTDIGDEAGKYAIPVHSLVIRSGPDGVGLQFVLEEGKKQIAGPSTAEVVNGKQLEQFLRSLRKDQP